MEGAVEEDIPIESNEGCINASGTLCVRVECEGTGDVSALLRTRGVGNIFTAD